MLKFYADLVTADKWEAAIANNCNLTQWRTRFLASCYEGINLNNESCFLFENSADSIPNDCLKKCCMPRISYAYEVKKRLVPVELRKELGCAEKNNSMFLYMKKQRIKLTIVKENKRIAASDLFGLVGGYLGLFVGVSIITVLEMMEFVFISMLNRFRGKTTKTEEIAKNSNERN